MDDQAPEQLELDFDDPEQEQLELDLDDELWSLEKCAEYAGFTRWAMYKWVGRYPDFPRPVQMEEGGPMRVYRNEFLRWLRKRQRVA